MKKLLLLVAIAFHLRASGQEKIIFQDRFRNNKNGWKLRKDKNFLVQIENGVLHLEKFEKNRIKNGCLWYNKIIPGFNTLNNFSITFYARFISGGDLFEDIDIQWGQKGQSSTGNIVGGLYKASFWMNRKVHLDYFDTGWSYFVHKDVSHVVPATFKPDKLNKYEIIQKDGFVIFKVNDLEVLKQLSKATPGASIGFLQCMKSAWEIDKIIIRQDENAGQAPAPADPVVNGLNKDPYLNFPSDNKDIRVYPNPFTDIINVDFTLDKGQTVILILTDMQGTVIQQHTKSLRGGPQSTLLYADIIPGSYVLTLQLADGKKISRTVIRQ